MIYVILTLLFGLALLFSGAHFLVKNSVVVAKRFNLSQIFIGVTIVSIGTSMPEAIVSIEAALTGHPDIVLGNIIGSNIANILLVLPCAVLLRPIVIDPRSIRWESTVMLVTTVVFYLMCLTGTINRLFGLILMIGFVLFNYYLLHSSKTISEEVIDIEIAADKFETNTFMYYTNQTWVRCFGILFSIIMLLYGSHLFVQSSVAISVLLGVSEGVIGLTLVAIGTSAPEIFTSILAAKHGHSDIAVGNVIGSNIFNILGVTGLTALITDIPVNTDFLTTNFYLLLAISFGMVIYICYKKSLSSLVGYSMLTGYALYLAYLYT